MSFLSLGSGFVNAAVERQKENRDESRDRRKLAMEVFLKDTMPRIRAAQEKDNKFASDLNSMMSDSYYAGKPELAFYSKKWQERTGQDEMAFRAYARTNQLPEEVTAAARAKLAQDFNIDPNTNQLSWKQIPPTIPPAQPQGRKPTFMDRLLTRGDAQQDIQRGTSEIAAMAGVDPNAPTTARSEGLSIPGSFESIDQQARARAEKVSTFVMQNPDYFKNPYEFMQEYISAGPEEATKKLQGIPKQIRESEALQLNFQKGMQNFVINNIGDFNNPSEVLKGFARGKVDPDAIINTAISNLKTPEERAAEAARLKRYEMPNGKWDWLGMLPDTQAMANIFPDPATRKAVTDTITSAILAEGQTQMASMFAAAGMQVPAGLESSSLNIKTTEQAQAELDRAQTPPPPAAVEPPPAQPTPEPEGPVTAEEVDALLRSRGSLTFGETSARQSEDTAAAIDAAAPMPAGFNEEEATQRFRSLFGMGDSTTEPKQDKKTKKERTDFVMNASPEEIQKEDPVQFLFDSRTVKNRQRREEIASSIRATPAILAKANNDERYGSLFNDVLNQYVFPYAPEAASLEEAQQKYEPYSFVIVDGTIQLIGPK